MAPPKGKSQRGLPQPPPRQPPPSKRKIVNRARKALPKKPRVRKPRARKFGPRKPRGRRLGGGGRGGAQRFGFSRGVKFAFLRKILRRLKSLGQNTSIGRFRNHGATGARNADATGLRARRRLPLRFF